MDKELYDISVALGSESCDWPKNLEFTREIAARIQDGEVCNLSNLHLTTHVGTHVDTPLHFVDGKQNLNDYPIEHWIRPAHVVSIKDKEAVRPEELKHLDIKPGDALLFKTENSVSGRNISGIFFDDFVDVSPEAAEFCVEKKVGLIGVDYLSVDRRHDPGFPAHHIILGNGILILEHINLKDVPPGKYTLFCFPLKIHGAEGAPARAILIR